MVLVASSYGAVDNVSTPILVLHGDYTIRYASPAAYRLLGYRPGTLAGEALADLIPLECHPVLDHAETILAHEGGCKFRSRVVRADGRPVDVLFTIEPAPHGQNASADVMVSLTPVPPWGLKDSGVSPLRQLDSDAPLVRRDYEILIEEDAEAPPTDSLAEGAEPAGHGRSEEPILLTKARRS